MVCTHCNVIHIRAKDGTRTVCYRCADPQSLLFTQNVTEEQCHLCPSHSVPEVPNLPQRVGTWVKAVADWKIKGSPQRISEEVQHIFHTFCAANPPCSWYDPAGQLCKGCGCGVSEGGTAVFNKIKMATQHCPRNLW